MHTNQLILGDNLEVLRSLPQPIGVFIDGGNIFFSQKNMGWNIDWIQFKKLFPKNSIIRYFTAFDPNNQNQIKHNSFLANNGFKLITKPLHTIKGNHKGNLDVELVWELSKRIVEFQSFVLVSGDGYFECVLSDLKNIFKKQVVVIGSSTNSNYKLVQNYRFVSLESIQSIITKKNTPRQEQFTSH